MVGKPGGIFVLPPEAARMDEEAVVGAVFDDLGQGTGLAGLASKDLPVPAHLLRLEQCDAVFLVVGDNKVGMTVLVQVDEPVRGFLSLLTDDIPWDGRRGMRIGCPSSIRWIPDPAL